MIGWNTLLYNHKNGRHRGPNPSPRVLCRGGGPHHLVLLGQVVDMETMRLLLAQTDKKTTVMLDRLRLPYFTNVHYNEQRNTPYSEPLVCGRQVGRGCQKLRKMWITRHSTLLFADSRDFGSLTACYLCFNTRK